LATESVAFLKPRGGRWFEYLGQQLGLNAYQFVTLTREEEWPKTGGNIGLSTMYSAKGLEFDHVLVLGLNEEVTPVGVEEDDTSRSQMRRLLAMAITRARQSVIIGCKPDEASSLLKYLDPKTYREVVL
jgi:superfamily I DNA/RNA helicase